MRLKKLIIAFICLISLGMLTGCGKIKSYNDMNTLRYEKILSMSSHSPSGTYYVIIYRTGCAVCEGILPTVTEYANMAKKDSSVDPIYSLNKSDKKNNGGINLESTDENNKGLGATVYTQIKLNSAPVLLKITDGKVVKLIDMRTKILAEFQTMLGERE